MSESLGRGKQFQRKIELLRFLENSRHGMTPQELHRTLEEQVGYKFDRKCIERDCKSLQECGFPIDRVATTDPERPKVWKMTASNYVKILSPSDHVTLSVTELLAFSAARELFLPLAGTPFWEGIHSMWNKIEEAMPRSVWQHLERELPLWHIRGPAPKDYLQDSGKISALNRACFQHRTVELTYQKPEETDPRVRLVHPYAIVLEGNQLVLIAVEPADDEAKYKHFKLDRIVRVKNLDKRFKPRDDFDPEEHFRHSLGVYRGDKVETFQIRFSTKRAAWARETPFHSDKTIEEQSDGSVIVEFKGYFEELIPRILGQGDQAEVLAPESARQRIREITTSLAKMYGGQQTGCQS